MPKIILFQELKTSIRKAKALFWDIKSWQAVWNPIHQVDVIYDDCSHQEFLMDLSWNGNLSKIRTVRFLESNQILFFSPTPPSPMNYHVGSWIFHSLSDKSTLITLEREYRISVFPNEEEEIFLQRLNAFHHQFTERLELLLNHFSKINYEAI